MEQIVNPAKEYASLNQNKYDCVVGFSGGKDSSWVLYRAVKEYGLTPLAVTYDHGYPLDEASAYNLREIPKKLDVDHMVLTAGDEIRKAMEEEGLSRIKDFCLHCHRGVGAFTAEMAYVYDIPVVLWGEPATYDVEETTSGFEHFEKWFDCGVFLDGGPTFDRYNYPDTPKDDQVQDVYLGNYERWDQWEHADILTKELGWKRCQREGSPVDWDKVDCVMEPLRYWQGWLKHGTDHRAFTLSKGIRLGHITREAALEILSKDEGRKPEHLKWYLEQLGMTEEEFEGMVKSE
jgi:hypothetical protein